MSSNSFGGIGLSGLTFLIFLTLKLSKVIDWSWWWVTSPLWITLGLFIVVFVLVCIIMLLGILLKGKT
jgi:hypothetical protein